MEKTTKTEKGFYTGIGIIFLLFLYVSLTHFYELTTDKLIETSPLIVAGLLAGIRAYYIERILKIHKNQAKLTFKAFIDNTELTRLLTIYFVIIPLTYTPQTEIEKKYKKKINALTFFIYGAISGIIFTLFI